MKPAARSDSPVVRLALAMLMCVAALAPIARAGPPNRDLLAHGTDQYFWSADVTPAPPNELPATVNTVIRFRTAGDMLRWQKAAELSAQPTSLANRGSELLVVLDDGSWKIVSASGGTRSGTDLPGGYAVLALAGDGDDIWAAGAPDASRTPATQTAAAATTTNPATTESATFPAQPRGLTLFRLHSGAWSAVAPLPVDVTREHVQAISLAMLDDRLTLAIVGLDRAVRVYSRGPSGWGEGADVGTFGLEDPHLKLLNVRGRPALWIAERKEPSGRLLFRADGRWQPSVKLADSPALQKFDQRDLASALGQLRLLASDGKGRLAEQLYNPDGSLQGQASEGVIDRSDTEQRISTVIKFIVFAVLIVWMLGAMRQRPNLQEALARIDKLNLASMGRRLAGGMIDLLPLLLGFVAAGFSVRGAEAHAPGAPISYVSPEFLWTAAGLVVYFLHTTVF